MKDIKPPRIVEIKVVTKNGSPLVGRDGGLLYLSLSHYFKFKARLGGSTDNKTKVMVLKLIFMIIVENGV
jgi:hypothetical protein